MGFSLSGSNKEDIKFLGIAIGGLLIALWWFSRKHLITISSKGGSHLNFIVEKMNDETIEGFVTKVQNAKLKRITNLQKTE